MTAASAKDLLMRYCSCFGVPPMTAVVSLSAMFGSIGVASADMNGRELQLKCRFYPSAIHLTEVCLALYRWQPEMFRALNKVNKPKKTCEPATGAASYSILLLSIT